MNFRAELEFQRRRQERRHRDIEILATALLDGVQISVVCPTREQSQELYDAAIRRAEELGFPKVRPENGSDSVDHPVDASEKVALSRTFHRP